MQSKAARLLAARGEIRIEDTVLPEPGAGEVLLRMEACGVCHSDVFVAGLEKLPLTPLTLGHEGIGRVEAVGEGVTKLAGGDRVGMTFLAGTCGTCEWCAAGLDRYCAKQWNFGYTLHGGMSQWVVARASHLVRIPEEIDAAEAAPLCCAGWTSYGALRNTGLESGQKVALFGYGGLGHLALQIARARGLEVAVADVSELKLEHARADGAAFTAPSGEAGKAIQKQFGGVDAAIVLTASAAAIQQAFRALKRTGTLVLVGLSTSMYELPLVDTVLKGIQIKGSYLGTPSDLTELFALARTGAVRAHVECHELAAAASLIESLRQGTQHGRAVITF